jgi:ATP-binding cassette, subfamily B, bacterial MsbA
MGMLCGVVAGLSNPMLMGSIKLVFEVVFPQPGAPTISDRLQGLSLLGPGDLPNAPRLIYTIQTETNSLSRSLWTGLSDSARQMLQDTNATRAQQQTVFLEELNRRIRTTALYDPERFAGVALRPTTRRQLERDAQGPDRIRLNVALLEDAYPGLIKTESVRRLPGWVNRSLEALKTPLKQLSEERPRWLVILVIAMIPFSMLVRGLFTYLNVYLMNWVSVRAAADLRSRLFSHLMGMSAGFFTRISTGDLMSRLNEVNLLHQTISQAMVVLVKEPVSLLGLMTFLLLLQPKLTLVALTIFPVTLVPFIIYARKVRKSSVAIYQQYADMGRMMHESFTGFRIVKAYNLEQKVVDEFTSSSRAAVSHHMRILRSMEIPGPLMEFIASFGIACFFVYIALFSHASPGDLIAFIGSVFLAYQPIKALIRLHNQLSQAQAATQYAFGILKTESTILEPRNPVPLRAEHADITFESVSFRYGEKTAVAGIQLTVKAGQMVALVGSSGSGKTTLTNLLLRFYDPNEGAIRIGGTDIRQATLSDLRRQMAIVTQETVLFNDTIANNIGLGRPGASLKEVVSAAKHAHAHDFIMDKPHGYDTVVGEKGIALSGGQRQRIAIARAILKNAPILILDEATSALDTESERAIQTALEDLMQHRTTICIAHRLSTIQNADLIVVLHEGRIVETGRHAELLQRAGMYRKLYELQFHAG